MAENTFLGRGWAFPVSFTKGENGVQMVEYELDIKQSLEILLSTTKGERVMQLEYGAELKDLLFEPLNISFAKRMSNRLEKAILFYEPRIKVNDISFFKDANEGIIQVKIEYTIIATNSRRNLVYPFYQNEGTDIPQQ